MSYHFELETKKEGKPQRVIVHEEEFPVPYTEEMLVSEIAQLKLNKRAYTNEYHYEATLAMLEGALRFLREEQS